MHKSINQLTKSEKSEVSSALISPELPYVAEMVDNRIKVGKRFEVKSQTPSQTVDNMSAEKREKRAKHDVVEEQSAESLRTMKSKTFREWTPEHISYLEMRNENMAFVKFMYERSKEIVQREIEADPRKYFGDSKMSAHIEETVGAGSASRFLFFVVNPEPKAQEDLEKINKLIMKTLSKCWVRRSMFSYEQRGTLEENFGTGLHINILIEKKKKYMSKRWSECLKEVKNTWKSIVKVSVPNTLAVRYAPVEDNFVKYLKGEKVDAEKAPLVEADRVWRRDVLRVPDLISNWEDGQIED